MIFNKNKIKTYSIARRKSKVKAGDFAKPPRAGLSFAQFYQSLPDILKAKDTRAVVGAVIKARKARKPVIFMAGAHVIKCGLSPVVIELLKKKIITCVALNGAGIIHDFEIAYAGVTSEDVAKELRHGRFGMVKETADFLNAAIKEGAARGYGIGYSVGKMFSDAKLPYNELSIIYHAFKLGVPLCVHVAIGTDIIHQHPSFDPSSCAEASFRDFHLLVEEVSRLNNGGVVLNFGSAVILPEVFLKALNLARNMGGAVKDFVTANFDMIYQYRPAENIVRRPAMGDGKGYYIIGHHEIMLPFLAQAIMEKAG
jgi:hypothetical protein